MPEFNNIEYELTNGEKFALVCGMLAGLRLQDKTQPPSQVTVTLEPIGINGLGTIGLMAEDVQYTGVNKISIPVITHDVDTSYSGFSLLVSYDNGQIVINSISDGDFGTLQGTSIQSDKAYTRCMLDKGKFKNEHCIMCWLNCTIVTPPTKGNPIEIKFENSTGYNPNYCSLLTWVLNETDGNYYSYFITPTVNKGCKITSDELPSNESNLGDETQTSALASPSLIAMGTTVIYPGKQGLVPIYTNCNLNDDFVYNGFILKAVIPEKWLSILSEIGVGSTGEWTITYTIEYDTDGNLILNIIGSRDEAKADNSTVGFIRFFLSEEATSIECIVENAYSELTGPYGALGVIKGDGYIGYPPPPSGGGGSGYGGGSSGWGSGGGAGGGSGGGTYGSGTIWSGSSQDIWIDMGGGNKYPIHLEPGYNDVNVWIPTIYPEDKWVETTPTIEAPGYILIPGGFEWETTINPAAPLGLSSPRITERFEIKDVFDIEKITPEPPINLDEILDEYNIVDINSLTVEEINILLQIFIDNFEINDTLKEEIINIIVSDSDFSDNMELQDVFDIEKITPEPPINLDEILDEYNIVDINSLTVEEINILLQIFIDNFEINDTLKEEIINIIVSDSDFSDNMELQDIFDIDIEHPPNTYNEANIDELSIEDTISTTLVNLSIINTPTEEPMELEDLTSQEALKCNIIDHPEIEEIGMEDLTSQEALKCNIIDHPEIEEIGMEDLYDIELT